MSVTTSSPPQKARTTIQNIGLILAFIVLVGILLLPTPETLSTGGHRMIGVLAFAIILWMTSAGYSQCLKTDYFRLFFSCDDSRRCRYVYFCSHA